jgi:outer membrane protein assembly factor BamB
VALDAAGDVFVTEQIVTDQQTSEASVVKLAGATGVPLWEHALDSSAYGFRRVVRVTSGGDVVVAASLQPSPGALESPVVFRLAGADGGQQWRRDLSAFVPGDGFDYEVDLAVAPTGDVVVGGSSAREVPGEFVGVRSVFMLSGASGALSWTHVFPVR